MVHIHDLLRERAIDIYRARIINHKADAFDPIIGFKISISIRKTGENFF